MRRVLVLLLCAVVVLGVTACGGGSHAARTATSATAATAATAATTATATAASGGGGSAASAGAAAANAGLTELECGLTRIAGAVAYTECNLTLPGGGTQLCPDSGYANGSGGSLAQRAHVCSTLGRYRLPTSVGTLADQTLGVQACLARRGVTATASESWGTAPASFYATVAYRGYEVILSPPADHRTPEVTAPTGATVTISTAPFKACAALAATGA